MSKNKKKKKEKVTYIDDGRTIADMSGTGKINPLIGGTSKSSERGKRRATVREQWKTYTEAVKMMFFPMLVVLGILTVAFLIMYLIYK
ncbi:MAG: hypothetical protein IJ515_03725 [Clostridia bacterium]|nr:hypothetical protein [Clostridia bacterium]